MVFRVLPGSEAFEQLQLQLLPTPTPHEPRDLHNGAATSLSLEQLRVPASIAMMKHQLLSLFILLLPSVASLSVIPSTSWKFRGHDIFAEVSRGSPAKPAVILVHGFGCSTTYWRETVKYLSENEYEVHALDLLGQGRSSKPGRAENVVYSINLWAQLVDEYAQENVQSNTVVLMGNSLGSLVALSAVCGDYMDAESGFLRDKTTGYLHV